MKNTLSKVFIFAAGAAIGSVVTWKLLDAKYTLRAEQEIEDVRDYYEGKYESEPKTAVNNEVIVVEADEFESMKKDYVELANKYNLKKGGSENMETNGTEPKAIHPDEFDELDEYDTISLTHYTDGVLADEDDNIIEDIANTVGEDYESHFGEYEDDAVYIRNDRLKTDYEILKDYRPYSDVVGIDSNLTGRG